MPRTINFLASVISNCKFLQTLILTNCDVTDLGVEGIKDALIQSENLKYFDLSYNRVSNFGLNVLGDVLVNNSKILIEINLMDNEITSLGFNLFIE